MKSEPSQIVKSLICEGTNSIDQSDTEISRGQDTAVKMSFEQLITFVWGPPGTGKTTLATVLANEIQMHYRMFNAVTGNKKELEQIFAEAKFYPGMVVIVDEVHRLNKDKQDLLLPHVEAVSYTHLTLPTKA